MIETWSCDKDEMLLRDIQALSFFDMYFLPSSYGSNVQRTARASNKCIGEPTPERTNEQINEQTNEDASHDLIEKGGHMTQQKEVVT